MNMHLYLLYVCLKTKTSDMVSQVLHAFIFIIRVFVCVDERLCLGKSCVCVCVCVCVADYERPLNVEVVETGMEVFRGKTVFIVRHAQVLEFAHA